MLSLVLFACTMTLSEADMCTSGYELQPTCAVSYGVIIEMHGNVRSSTNCAMLCSETTDCMSALFDKPGKTCTLNSDTTVNLNLTGCSYFLRYLEMKNIGGISCPRTISEPNAQAECSVDTDCTYPLSSATCFNGTCTCDPQLSLDPTTGNCVTGCSSGGQTFRRYPGYIPPPEWNPWSSPNEVNIAECELTCLADPTCRYAVFYGGCFMSTILEGPLVIGIDGDTSVRECA